MRAKVARACAQLTSGAARNTESSSHASTAAVRSLSWSAVVPSTAWKMIRRFPAAKASRSADLPTRRRP